MTPQSARGARPAPPQGAKGQAALPRAGAKTASAAPAAPRPGGSKPSVATEWNAFLASRAEAIQKARSRKRRRIAMLLVFFALVLAYGPVQEYVFERYPSSGSLSGLFTSSVAKIKSVPHGIAQLFVPADEDSSDTPLASEGEANPNFGVMSLKSSAAILANADTGDVLLKKNADIQVYPASLTKIMTVLLAIEHRAELPERIVLTPALLQPLYEANSTMAGFLPGEAVETTDLIYGALLLSGGECAVALAQAVAGTEADFAAVMNARAREFGMFDTHFTNATGLHDPEHYTTVRDIAKLLLYALQNDAFAEVFTTKEYKTAPTNLNEDGRILANNLFARIESDSFAGGRILGGKTGWTYPAGQCLASLAEKNENHYIFVSVGNGVEADGTFYSLADARNAYENGILPVR
ncbi:MAG: serine hydrolase [Clostridiales Family XIII bacterium]|jgi:D-alanyl-D-alanine carboxypeptidase (penicillin-binding protein 5/6)|nr:serine hydrolase [Clostridiales Family XIII bacterium]